VQGRYDVVCPATTAYELKKVSSSLAANGRDLNSYKQVWPEITLHIVPDAGHSAREKGIAEILVQVRVNFA
jgi:proline iminopeptidase